LRAEYLKNPKPDKAARMQIVSKVALGEKEVQIWFQNKYAQLLPQPPQRLTLIQTPT
jgi:hypothetical protein